MFWLLYFFAFVDLDRTSTVVNAVDMLYWLHSFVWNCWIVNAYSSVRCVVNNLHLALLIWHLWSSCTEWSEKKKRTNEGNTTANEYSNDNTYSFIFLVVTFFRTHLLCGKVKQAKNRHTQLYPLDEMLAGR